VTERSRAAESTGSQECQTSTCASTLELEFENVLTTGSYVPEKSVLLVVLYHYAWGVLGSIFSSTGDTCVRSTTAIGVRTTRAWADPERWGGRQAGGRDVRGDTTPAPRPSATTYARRAPLHPTRRPVVDRMQRVLLLLAVL